jgi:hypothetical protein
MKVRSRVAGAGGPVPVPLRKAAEQALQKLKLL